MKILQRLFYILIVLLCLIFVSCKDRMGDMVLDYNSNFEPITEDALYKGKKPGDMGFDPNTMLQDKYFVLVDATLCLSAPPSCSSYNWAIFASEKEKVYDETVGDYVERDTEREISLPRSVGVTERYFIMYIQTSPLSVGSTYRLVLTVEDKDGNKYVDSSDIVVYDEYKEQKGA